MDNQSLILINVRDKVKLGKPFAVMKYLSISKQFTFKNNLNILNGFISKI